MSSFRMQAYMTGGVIRVVKDSLRATQTNRRENAFFLGYAARSAAGTAKRFLSELRGEHIPPFLIASITSSCNLHCAGCYARENSACSDEPPQAQLKDTEWDRIFTEAEALGIGFILLAGGEPLLRPDVLRRAAAHRGILFPVFTNGAFMKKNMLDLFDANRNLLPVISLEGDRETTDARRGAGVYDSVFNAMLELRRRGVAFGASVTVTKENMREVFSDRFSRTLAARGCKAVIFVEYVPVGNDAASLAPGEEERAYMQAAIRRLRRTRRGMVYISFPGDEKKSGGCVAAGRGFFHINSHGGAEPCPFSPFSDVSVKDLSVREALKSPLFTALRDGGLLWDDHAGGCTLFEKKEQVEAIMRELSSD